MHVTALRCLRDIVVLSSCALSKGVPGVLRSFTAFSASRDEHVFLINLYIHSLIRRSLVSLCNTHNTNSGCVRESRLTHTNTLHIVSTHTIPCGSKASDTSIAFSSHRLLVHPFVNKG